MKKLSPVKFILLIAALSYLAWFIPQAMGYWFRWQSLLTVPVLFFYARRLRKLAWCIAAFMAVVSCYAFIGLRFGPPSIGVVLSVINTNMAEAYEQYTSVPIAHIGLFLLAIISIYIYCISTCKRPSSWRVWVIGLVLLVPTLQSGLFFKRFRECITYTIKHYREEKAELQHSLSLKPEWLITKPYTAKGKIHVVIIGESARADYFSVYGYPLNTSPFLSQRASLVINDAIVPGSSTLISVPRILSINEDHFHIRHAYDAVTLAHAAGLETWWISDQGYMGYSDSGITHIASRSDHTQFLQAGEYDSRSVDDFEVLPPIEAAIAAPTTKDKVIFVHTLGSHEDPCKRVGSYPLIGQPEWKAHLNCYVTSIKKTDELIARINLMLEQAQHPYEIIYFADHGLRVTQDVVQHSSNTREAYHVPFIVIDSEVQGQTVVAEPFDIRHFIDFFAAQLGIETSLTAHSWQRYTNSTSIKPIAWDKEHLIDLEQLSANPAITP